MMPYVSTVSAYNCYGSCVQRKSCKWGQPLIGFKYNTLSILIGFTGPIPDLKASRRQAQIYKHAQGVLPSTELLAPVSGVLYLLYLVPSELPSILKTMLGNRGSRFINHT